MEGGELWLLTKRGVGRARMVGMKRPKIFAGQVERVRSDMQVP